MLKLIIKEDYCTGCALCVDGCPVPSLAFDEKREKAYIIDEKGCLICRTCEQLCETGAIEVSFDDYREYFDLEGAI